MVADMPIAPDPSAAAAADESSLSANVGGRTVRDSIEIGTSDVVYKPHVAHAPDRSELSLSNQTERTVATIDSTSDRSLTVVGEHPEEAPVQSTVQPAVRGGDAARTALPGPSAAPSRSAMKHKTLAESLQTTYEGSRRKHLRSKKSRSKRSSLRDNMSKTLSNLKIVTSSKRFLFDQHDDNKDGIDHNDASDNGPNDNCNDCNGNDCNASRGSSSNSLSKRSKSENDLHLAYMSNRTDYEEEAKDTVPALITSSSNVSDNYDGGNNDTCANSDNAVHVHPATAGRHMTIPGASPAGFVDRRAPMAKMKSLSKMKLGGTSTGSMRKLMTSSKQKLFNNSLSSLFSHGSKSTNAPWHEDDMEDDDEEDDGHTTVLAWDYVEIREYDPEIDANPSVSRGPAVTLSWEYTVSNRIQLDRYEVLRPPRREMKEMRLPQSEREARLLSSGVTRSEMQAAIKKINVAKKKRARTVAMLHHYTWHERVEGAKKKMLKMVGVRKKHEKEEEDLWVNAQAYFGA